MVAPGESCSLGAVLSGAGQHRHQGQVETGAPSGLLRRFEAAAAATRLDGGEADDGKGVGGEIAGLALGLRQPTSPSF